VTRPLSLQVRDQLLEAIRAGGFADDRLPPEAELAVQLGVSRTTVRAALQGLEADGVVTRRRRHGTAINAHLLRASMPLNRLVSFRELIEQCGHVASADPPATREDGAPDVAATALGVEPGTPSVVVDRILRAGGEPVIAICDVVPVVHLRVAPGDVHAGDSTFAFLAADGVAPAAYATTELVPLVATADRPAGLRIPAGRAYVELRETLFSEGHDRIAFSSVAVDDAMVRLSLLRREG
jgi:DNA-binding GntR family transcriptional regulator